MRNAATGASLADIEAVYRLRVDNMRRVAGAIVGDPEAALDIVQDAFASAVRERSRFRGDASVETWVARIVVNAAYSYLRKARPRGLVEVAQNSTELSAGTTERVRMAVSRLPDRQRLVLFLHYYGDLDYEAIAETIGISSGTVGATLTAARSSLRQQLEEVLT